MSYVIVKGTSLRQYSRVTLHYSVYSEILKIEVTICIILPTNKFKANNLVPALYGTDLFNRCVCVPERTTTPFISNAFHLAMHSIKHMKKFKIISFNKSEF